MTSISQSFVEAVYAACNHRVIASIFLSDSGQFRINFTPEATVEQKSAANTAAAAFDFAGVKAKVAAFDAAIAAGFAVLPEGFTLPIDDDSRNTWVALKGQLRDGLDLGAFADNTTFPVPITAIDGSKHSLTVRRLREILFAGGAYYAGLLAARDS